MKIFILLLGLLTLSTTFADEDIKDSAKDEARAQCNRITGSSELQIRCIKAVTTTLPKMNRTAIKQCARINDAEVLTTCIESITDIRSEAASNQCSRMNEDTTIVKCYKAINGRIFRDEKDANQCNRYNETGVVIECLKKLSYASHPNGADKFEMSELHKIKIRDAIELINNGQDDKAIKVLKALI